MSLRGRMIGRGRAVLNADDPLRLGGDRMNGAVHAAATEPQGIICVRDGASAPDHSPAQAHKNLCCTLSCHGSGAAGPAPVATILDPVAPLAVASVPSPDRPGLRLTSNVLPLGSRAPPRLG